jgi:Leucine-rich repeat (LRR) protein
MCRELAQILYFDAPLAGIDLESLATCHALSIVWLSHNELTELDLRPLAKLPLLSALELSDGELASVDLGTEAGFATLTHLHLHANPLHELDLRALAKTRLRVLNLPDTLRDRVDLSPLGPRRKDLEINFRP